MNHCLNIAVIPQFRETCWFNAILMSCFYSQGLRKLMINKKDNLTKFIRQIIKNSYNKENVKLFNKIKPELLLLNILNKNNHNMKKTIIKNKVFNWNSKYISEFLKYYHISVLDITYVDNKFIFNFFKTANDYEIKVIESSHYFDIDVDTNINHNPDVLLFNLTDNLIYKELVKVYPDLEKLDSSNFDIHFEKELNEVIEFNGHTYKLDSVLLNNYNNFEIQNAHSIVGITCENKRYVYNGWNSMINKNENYPCSLMEYDWDIGKDQEFCLNPNECKLTGIDKKDLCFSFHRGERILVYVKVDNSETKRLSSSSSFKNFSNINEIKEDLRKLFDYQTREEVEEQLKLLNIRYNPVLSLNINKKILLYAIYDDYNIQHSHIIDDIQQEYYPFDESNNKNLFFYYFIKNVEVTYKSIMKQKLNHRLREIYNSQIDIRKLVEIFKMDLDDLKREFSRIFNELFIYYKISANDKFIYIHRDIIIKLFKLDFLIPYLIGNDKSQVSTIDDLNIYLLKIRDNNKEKNEIIKLFNHLRITAKVTTIEELLVSINDLYRRMN
jgi:hypothetical protein